MQLLHKRGDLHEKLAVQMAKTTRAAGVVTQGTPKRIDSTIFPLTPAP